MLAPRAGMRVLSRACEALLSSQPARASGIDVATDRPRRLAAPGGSSRLTMRGLEVLAIVLPLLFLAAVETVHATLLHGAASYAFLFGLVLVGVVAFSHKIFRAVRALNERIVEQNEQLAALNRIAAALAESPALEPLLLTAVDEVLGAVKADAGLVCAVDLNRMEHSIVAARGFSEEVVAGVQRARLCDDPIALQVVETGLPVMRLRLRDDPKIAEAAARENVSSSMSVPIKSQREIVGILAVATRAERRFDAKAQKFAISVADQLGPAIRQAATFQRLLQRNREMEALLTVSGAVTSLALPSVLDRALETILEVTSAEAAELWLADGRELTLAHHRGSSSEALHETTRLGPGEGLPGRALEKREPIVARELSCHPGSLGRSAGDAGFETYCALPLVHGDEALGVLGVAARGSQALTEPDELRLLGGVGEVIAVGVENARLMERVQDEAVLEERERIAREMHDGLAQVLTYVNAQSIAIGKLLVSGEPSKARHELAQMEAAVRDVYADVREAILGLRTSPRSDGGLLLNLRRYLERFEEATGIETRLEVGEAAQVKLPSSVEIQLTRIVQEALSNVRKHARARTATVAFELAGRILRVLVQDDGQGFEPGQLRPRGWPRFGLQTMRERAEAVGGRFTIASRAGDGTSVVIELALEQPIDAGATREPVAAGRVAS